LFNINQTTTKDLIEIEEKYGKIHNYMKNVKSTLDDAVYGHDNAKKQIERIIGQWINGKQDGYCFGFEGPAGVGKTTLAKKGLANCLKDENGKYYDYNMIMYVCLHELAHAFSNSVDENHTGEEFKENFRKLLKKGEEVGIFNPSLPLNYDYCKK
jgi:predicted AAA+ superfamily ATPase